MVGALAGVNVIKLFSVTTGLRNKLERFYIESFSGESNICQVQSHNNSSP